MLGRGAPSPAGLAAGPSVPSAGSPAAAAVDSPACPPDRYRFGDWLRRGCGGPGPAAPCPHAWSRSAAMPANRKKHHDRARCTAPDLLASAVALSGPLRPPGRCCGFFSLADTAVPRDDKAYARRRTSDRTHHQSHGNITDAAASADVSVIGPPSVPQRGKRGIIAAVLDDFSRFWILADRLGPQDSLLIGLVIGGAPIEEIADLLGLRARGARKNIIDALLRLSGESLTAPPQPRPGTHP